MASSNEPPQFPSGIPDPPIFQKLGFKDRGYLRRNIELQAQKEREEANMSSSEQTYVYYSSPQAFKHTEKPQLYCH